MSDHIKFASEETNPDLDIVSDVSPDEVYAKRDQVCLIDVRRPDEYNGELGHAPGAQLFTLDELADHFSEIPQDKTVIFICRSGRRSASATALAKDQGYSSVYNMKGGMLAWNAMGLETERSSS